MQKFNLFLLLLIYRKYSVAILHTVNRGVLVHQPMEHNQNPCLCLNVQHFSSYLQVYVEFLLQNHDRVLVNESVKSEQKLLEMPIRLQREGLRFNCFIH